jgi:DNA polymerase IV
MKLKKEIKIFLHLDLDSFFISAEIITKPYLRDVPCAVGGRSQLSLFDKERTPNGVKLAQNNNSGAFVTPIFHSQKEKTFENTFLDEKGNPRGIITTCNYPARAKNVKTAMSLAQALQICPELVILPSNYPLYHDISENIRNYLESVVPHVESFSIDEWFLSVSGWIDECDVYNFALFLQDEVYKRFGIPSSIGICKTSKWIAKLSTSWAKPYGVYEVKDVDTFIKDIPIGKFPGIGSQYEKRLLSYGISHLGDIKQNKSLFYSWKKPGIQLYERVLGIDNEPIELRQERKSIGISRTFDRIIDKHEVYRRIMVLARHICYMVSQLNVNPTTYYLKINYTYNQSVKQSKKVQRLFSEDLFKTELHIMFDEIALQSGSVIKISLSVSNFSHQKHQAVSLIDFEEDVKAAKLTDAMNLLRDKFGIDIIKSGSEM